MMHSVVLPWQESACFWFRLSRSVLSAF